MPPGLKCGSRRAWAEISLRSWTKVRCRPSPSPRSLAPPKCCFEERAARALASASARGLQIIGSAGLLVRAKERGLINAVQPYLQRMRAQGVRFSDRFVRALLKQIGE